MAIAGITDFFREIVRDLHTSLYIAIGGSIEEDSLDWTSKSVELVSTAIKILILLAVLGFFIGLPSILSKKAKAALVSMNAAPKSPARYYAIFG